MFYEQLFAKAGSKVVQTGFIGSGVFSTPMITQSFTIPYMNTPVIADLNIEAAKAAFLAGGVSAEDIVVCDSLAKTKTAIEAGKRVVVEDGNILMDLPLDVIVTATRIPENAAYFGEKVIMSGKHLVMIDKEAESVIGSILKHKAEKQGVVFTTDMGDQPGLVMGLVSWARVMGFEVVSAGNIRNYTYEPATGKLSVRFNRSVTVLEKDRWAFETIPPGQVKKYVEVRQNAAEAFSIDEECGDPICHLVIAGNGTGLLPDTPVGHRPCMWWREFPEVLAPESEGGILSRSGIMEEPYLLKEPGDNTPGGNMYVTIACHDKVASKHMLSCVFSNHAGKTMFIYRPFQLGSAEANISVLCAGLLGVGAAEKIYPHVDAVARAARDMKAGEVVGSSPGTLGWDHSVRAGMIPGITVGPDNPVPFFMLSGNRLKRDVSAGTVITLDMIEEPRNSHLWRLRREQDQVFFGGKK